MPLVQLVARAHRPYRPLDNDEASAWMWQALRRAFPIAISAKLMPNHLHLLPDVPDPMAARDRLARILGQWRRRFACKLPVWEPVPAPRLVEGEQACSRLGRYFALNAVRAGLVDDPLVWPWSTYRDVMGAVVDPWVDAERVLRISRCPDAAAYHAYVSGDPSVAVQGTPPPCPAGPGEFPRYTLVDIATAAAAALRTQVRDVRKRGATRALFVAAAHAHGWRGTSQLARICDISRKSISELVRAVEPRELAPVWLCLGDPRLRARFELRREPVQLELGSIVRRGRAA